MAVTKFFAEPTATLGGSNYRATMRTDWGGGPERARWGSGRQELRDILNQIENGPNRLSEETNFDKRASKRVFL